jgi:branched-chain amino acid transport system permease protein
VVWEGFVGGILYALIAIGFVLIFKASGVVQLRAGHHGGVRGADARRASTPWACPAIWLALHGLAIGVMFLLASRWSGSC